MGILNRSQLKKAFQKGAIPSQQDFEDLVDSMLHKQDDGLVSQEDGLKISPKGSSRKMITFFNSLNDFKPRWSIEQHPKNNPDFGLNLMDDQGKSCLFIQSNGDVGVGTLNPASKLSVEGNIDMHGRRGTYAHGEVPGDGVWHNITPRLSDCHAFEVVAKIGKKGRGLYSMIHALAVSTFGRSRSRIRKSTAYYGSFRNKLDLRWSGSTFNYYLQARTRRNYGDDTMIRYHVTNLWWEDE